MAEIVNLYKHIDKKFLQKSDNPTFHLTGMTLPMRCLVVAGSGSGKTNWLCNYLLATSSGRGTFSKIQIITRDKSEPLYEWLTSACPQITISEGLQSLPALDDKNFDKSVNSLIILDDLVLSKDLSSVEQYFIRCRKKNVSIIFLSQSYYKVPKIIRGNTNYLVLLRLSGQKDVSLIMSEYSLGVDKERLMQIYEEATSEKFVPLIIAMDAPKEERFRKGFATMLPP